ncbi:hypothetical protein [Mucilaginibacter sp. L3T2-6]|uniref:hypothetical protein n=1 Tax=Mucilaginibacter sp. L3T2-6 TaxID=3062491 RepID=UPI0026775C8C|nr:hypothetical protein [Mucilaginibacter sp. L3T2-6]MDO3644672.1 hypothetical protein [Mucilaginibacter sp. L3T2-6]MDV6217124.1 hypothetical protein [Mucilaginibacter sp. L3T2-6]
MKSEMENKEWLNEYMSLKQVNPANPFEVPAGYFDNLGDRIVALRNLDELKSKGFSDGFEVPPDYFKELTDNIQSRITIETAMTGDPGFALPDGYFENLQQQIESRIFIEEALNGPAEDFAVPAGYFDKLNQSILDKTVNLNTVNQEKIKGGGIVRKLYASNFFKYATAACVTLALCGGILLSELTGSVVEHKGTFLHKELSQVPVDDIRSYLELNGDLTDAQTTEAISDGAIDDRQLENALQKDVYNGQ